MGSLWATRNPTIREKSAELGLNGKGIVMAMIMKNCSYCYGQGYYTKNERVPIPGGSWSPWITVKKTCTYCGGSGSISQFEADPSAAIGIVNASGSQVRSGEQGHSIGDMAQWWVQHIWPLKMLDRIGHFFEALGWRSKVVFALVGAVIALGVFSQDAGLPENALRSFMVQVAGESGVLVAAGLGALAGWIMPMLLGAIISGVTHLVGVAIVLGISAALIWFLWQVVQWFSESP